MTDMSSPSSDAPHGGPPLREHVFDGIQEYDNRLPRWWLWTLHLTVVFGLFYWLHYAVLQFGPSAHENYLAAVKADDEKVAARLGPISNEMLVGLSKLESKVAAGRQEFITTCVQCHREDGGGGIGPNLTDDYWLHGGEPMDLLRVIRDGVTDKGMAAWGDSLGMTKITELVAYLETIRSKNVTGGKEPQGKKQAD